MLKNAADCVLASLNASTYWKVRLGISLAAALSDDAFEHPAGLDIYFNVQLCVLSKGGSDTLRRG